MFKSSASLKPHLFFHSISGDFLKTLAWAHYEGKHNPPRKAFDFYTAIALARFLQRADDGKAAEHSSMMAERRVRRLFFSDEYGLTFVSVDHTWDATLERYISNINTRVEASDDPFTKTKKEYFYKEIHIMRNIPLLSSLKAIYPTICKINRDLINPHTHTCFGGKRLMCLFFCHRFMI